MASEIILNASKDGSLSQVKFYGIDGGNTCFMLKREVGKSKVDLKYEKKFQHVKPSVNRKTGNLEFLEYSYLRKYYKTLEEWVETTGCTMDDVIYGRRDYNETVSYISLAELLQKLGYTPATASHIDPAAVDEDIDDLTRLFQKLRTNSVPISQIMVP